MEEIILSCLEKRSKTVDDIVTNKLGQDVFIYSQPLENINNERMRMRMKMNENEHLLLERAFWFNSLLGPAANLGYRTHDEHTDPLSGNVHLPEYVWELFLYSHAAELRWKSVRWFIRMREMSGYVFVHSQIVVDERSMRPVIFSVPIKNSNIELGGVTIESTKHNIQFTTRSESVTFPIEINVNDDDGHNVLNGTILQSKHHASWTDDSRGIGTRGIIFPVVFQNSRGILSKTTSYGVENPTYPLDRLGHMIAITQHRPIDHVPRNRIFVSTNDGIVIYAHSDRKDKDNSSDSSDSEDIHNVLLVIIHKNNKSEIVHSDQVNKYATVIDDTIEGVTFEYQNIKQKIGSSFNGYTSMREPIIGYELISHSKQDEYGNMFFVEQDSLQGANVIREMIARHIGLEDVKCYYDVPLKASIVSIIFWMVPVFMFLFVLFLVFFLLDKMDDVGKKRK